MRWTVARRSLAVLAGWHAFAVLATVTGWLGCALLACGLLYR
ncbi:hypothetical protein ACLQ22_28595 [Micromonospora sp. DT178]